MLYLLVAILCGALFSVIFKLCQRRGISTLWVILFNYVTAAVVSWGSLFVTQASGGAAVVNPFAQGWVWLAALQGLLFMAGFSVMAGCTKACGVALTNVAARASLIVPVILSWLLLGQPAPAWLSVVLVIVALVLIALAGEGTVGGTAQGAGAKKSILQRPLVILLLVFMFYGISDFSLKLVQNSVQQQCGTDEALLDSSLSALTGTIFLMAAVISLLVAVCRPKDKRPAYSLRGILAGVALGLANLCCTAGMLRALTVLSTDVFYPLYNIGVVVMGMLAGVIFFKEKLRPLQYAGLAIAIIAIVLFF